MEFFTSMKENFTSMLAWNLNSTTTFQSILLEDVSTINPLSSPQCYRHATLEIISSNRVRLLLTILYTLTSIASLLSNALVIAVQFNSKKLYAHNFRKYLINLAVSDIVLGVFCVPFTYTDFVYRQWVFPHWLCPTAQYAQLLSVFITSCSLIIIGIERYYATIHPLSTFHRWFQTHTNCLLLFTWVVGSVYGYIPLIHTRTREFRLSVDSEEVHYQCSFGNDLSKWQRNAFVLVNFVITFLIPSVVLTVVYVAIMRKINSYRMSSPILYPKYFSNDYNKCICRQTSRGSIHRVESNPRLIGSAKSIHLMKNRSKVRLNLDSCFLNF